MERFIKRFHAFRHFFMPYARVMPRLLKRDGLINAEVLHVLNPARHEESPTDSHPRDGAGRARPPWKIPG